MFGLVSGQRFNGSPHKCVTDDGFKWRSQKGDKLFVWILWGWRSRRINDCRIYGNKRVDVRGDLGDRDRVALLRLDWVQEKLKIGIESENDRVFIINHWGKTDKTSQLPETINGDEFLHIVLHIRGDQFVIQELATIVYRDGENINKVSGSNFDINLQWGTDDFQVHLHVLEPGYCQVLSICIPNSHRNTSDCNHQLHNGLFIHADIRLINNFGHNIFFLYALCLRVTIWISA